MLFIVSQPVSFFLKRCNDRGWGEEEEEPPLSNFKLLTKNKVKGAFVYKMDPVYEDTMPTRFDESSLRPNRGHNLAHLRKIRSDYKAGAYQLGTQTLTGPAAAIKPYSSPPFNGNRKRPSIVSPEETRKNKSKNLVEL